MSGFELPSAGGALSTALWCDLRTDTQRSNWLLLGRGYETGVVAKSIQNELAMAYARLNSLAEAVGLLREARVHLPIAAASWNEDEHPETAAFHVTKVLELIGRVDAVLARSAS